MKLTVSIFVLLVTVCVCSIASAGIVSVTDTLYEGMNQMCMQGVPINPDPAVVFAGNVINNQLYRQDAATQCSSMYDVWAPWDFGGILLADGYQLISAVPGSYTYDTLGDVDSMDVWISLPKQGWTLLGNPYSYPYSWENVKVTDGNVTVSMQTAAKTNNWLQSVGFFYNASEGTTYGIGIAEDFQDTTDMPIRHGIWIWTEVDKIALILEAAPPPP